MAKIKFMTICMAAICEKDSNNPKVVLVGDRMMTNRALSLEFEHPQSKLKQITHNCVVATAGNALVHSELLSRVKNDVSEVKSPKIEAIIKSLKKCYSELRIEQIEETILKPIGIHNLESFYGLHKTLMPDIASTLQNRIENYDLNLDILVGGIDYLGPHIYYIHNPGISTPFCPLGYIIIGSGLPHAMNTFISHNYGVNCPLNEALYTIYKSKKFAENAPGVGSKFTDIMIIANNKVSSLTDNIINQLDELYNKDMNNKIKHDFSNLDDSIKQILQED